MLETIFVGKTFQVHLFVTDPRVYPTRSAKGNVKESSEAPSVQHKGFLENILMFDTISSNKTSSHHAHARA
ncbi:hypothetical protein A2U01_0055340 [Trifolium medium]|uniref:Uncharacterized protein n=1 Tax=Trifolium medium TaxID=97028 RepID=A0A392RDA8_9FABA|nr:hypothetical protein [Trifolium medium]